jgi:hypothetical protein
VFLQAIQARCPEPAVGPQPVIELRQWLGPDAVEPTLSVRTRLDQSRLPEHPKMLRHGRLAQMELIHELSYGSLTIAEKVEDCLPAGLGENLECRESRHSRREVYYLGYIAGKAS